MEDLIDIDIEPASCFGINDALLSTEFLLGHEDDGVIEHDYFIVSDFIADIILNGFPVDIDNVIMLTHIATILLQIMKILFSIFLLIIMN